MNAADGVLPPTSVVGWSVLYLNPTALLTMEGSALGYTILWLPASTVPPMTLHCNP